MTSATHPTQIRETIARMAEPVPEELWTHLAAGQELLTTEVSDGQRVEVT